MSNRCLWHIALLFVFTLMLTSCGSESGGVSAPAAPSNVAVTAGDGQATVSWDPVSGADSYNVYYKTAAGVTASDDKITGAASPYLHAGLGNGTTYYYALTAVNAAGESGLSIEVSATPQMPLPGVPANVTIIAGNGQVTVSWDPVSGADSYNIYWKTAAGVTTSDNKITGAASPYAHGPLSIGTTYYYAVSAVNAGGESGLSSEVSTMPTLKTAGIQKLLAADPQPEDYFGYSVSISGDYAIVGAAYEDEGGAESGAVYIFHRTGANTWDAGVKITAPDAEAGDYFGLSVSISGDYAIVGAYGEDGGGADAGAAYIFHRTGPNTWGAAAKITSPDAQAGDNFGAAVSISGDYAIVGAFLAHGLSGYPFTDTGAAYIFHRTDTNTWDAGTKITAPDASTNDKFGISISISGDYAIVGASYGDAGSYPFTDTGAAYIFHRTDTTAWDAGTKITAPDAQEYDGFGYAVSINGAYAIVGAYSEDGGSGDPLTNAGAAYIFHRTDTNTWDAGTKITASDAQAQDKFGWSVSISGDDAIIGAYFEGGSGNPFSNAGAVYLFHRTDTNTWEAGAKITAPDAQAGDRFGYSASINGDSVIVGAITEDGGSGDPSANAGAAYIY